MKFRYSVIASVLLSISLPAAAFAADAIYVDSNMVKKAQRVLTQRGFKTGVDGRMGPRTQAAVRGFQKAHNLEATGQLNRQTLMALGLQQSASAWRSGCSSPPPPAPPSPSRITARRPSAACRRRSTTAATKRVPRTAS
jgi:peptidoglycan hydrolase-like protein with peptidoglycan-binding domain